jgi:hypothetical protein
VTTEVFFVKSVAQAEYETSHECATAQTACHSIWQLGLMQDLLRQLDPDYYRAALLLIARTELEQLRQERSACGRVERSSKVPLGTSPLTDTDFVRAASVQSVSPETPYPGFP